MYLVGPVNGGQYFGVALLQVSTAIGLTEYSQLTPDTPQFAGPSSIQS